MKFSDFLSLKHRESILWTVALRLIHPLVQQGDSKSKLELYARNTGIYF